MKTAVTGLMFACVLMSASGCSGGGYAKAEPATKQMIAAMNDISEAMESVKDKESAKAAAPKIEAAVDKMKEAKKTLETVKGTKADEEKLNKEYLPKIAEVTTRMQKAGASAGAKCEAEPTFMKALEKMQTIK